MTQHYFNDLLRTKTFIPQLKDHIIRRSLLIRRLLEEGADKKLILIHAPAGYGKSTLVIQWLSELQKPHAMYSIDHTDNDLARFLTYIIFAVRQIQPDLCESVLPLIHSQEVHPTRIILTRLLNDLACLTSPMTLVLEDYHLIQSDSIHQAMFFLLQNLPAPLQIAITSRQELPFSTATLLARGEMLILDVSSLRFTRHETSLFAKDLLHLDLSAEELDELEKKTDGWVTSLQLALIGFNWENNSDFLQKLSGKDRLISGYLLDQVFLNQPARIQEFLLKTSILSRFCAPLCSALLDTRDNQEILDYLEKNNMFVLPLDNIQYWYRYHHLFAEFLQKRLQETNPMDLPELYKRASNWHERSGKREEAIEYMLKSGDFEAVCALIQPILVDKLQKGIRDSVIRWLSAIPYKNLREHILLWPYLIFANFDQGSFREGQVMLENLWSKEAFIDARPKEERGVVRGFYAAFHAALVIHTNLDAALAKVYSQRALNNFPEDARYGRSIGFGHFGSACLLLGEIAQAIKMLDEAIKESKKEEYQRLGLLWISYRAEAEIEAGQLRRGKQMCEDVLQSAQQRQARQTNLISNAVIGLGRIYYEWNEFGKAEQFLKEGIQLAEDGEYLDRLLTGYQHYFMYLLQIKDFRSAKKKIELAYQKAALYDNPPHVMEMISTLEAELALEMGNLTPVLIKNYRVDNWSPDDLINFSQFKWHTAAKIGIALGQYQASINLLEKLQEIAILNGRLYHFIQLGVSLVKASALGGNPSKATQNMLSLLQMAEPERFIRSFVDAGEPVLKVLHDCQIELRNKADPQSANLLLYTKRLISSFSGNGKKTDQAKASLKTRDGTALLTAKEHEVIALLEKGLKYSEISSQLFITENTLKTHIKNIYTKLNVRNRTEAVNKARSTG